MVRYYGWYSNRARGERAKKQAESSEPESPSSVEVIDVSDYQPRRLPSKRWRELIKQVWEVDPFDCPRCGSEMKLIALIDDNEVIEKILRHLDLCPENPLPARAPPQSMIQACPVPCSKNSGTRDYIHEPFFDGYSDYDEAVAG